TLGLEAEGDPHGHDDPHLRSAHSVMRHYVHAVDGDIGHVADFLYDDHSWRITHVVVATRTFRPGRKVLVPVRGVSGVSWNAGTVDVSLTGESIRRAPDYEGPWLVDRDYLDRVAAHYTSPLSF